jgi:hypothetical protein
MGNMINVVTRDPATFTPREKKRLARENLAKERRLQRQQEEMELSQSKLHGDFGPTWQAWSEDAELVFRSEWKVPEHADPDNLVVVNTAAKDVGRHLAAQMQQLLAQTKKMAAATGPAGGAAGGGDHKRIEHAWSWHFELLRLSQQQHRLADLYGLSILVALVVQTTLAVMHPYVYPENACGNHEIFCYDSDVPLQDLDYYQDENQSSTCDPEHDVFSVSNSTLSALVLLLGFLQNRQRPRAKAHDLMYAAQQTESEIYCFRASALHYSAGGTKTWASVLNSHESGDGKKTPKELFEERIEQVRADLDDERVAPGALPPTFAVAALEMNAPGRLFPGWEPPYFSRSELEAAAECENLAVSKAIDIHQVDLALRVAQRSGEQAAVKTAKEAVKAKAQLQLELEKLSLSALRARAEIRGCPEDKFDEDALLSVDNPKRELVNVIMAHLGNPWMQRAAATVLRTSTRNVWKEVAYIKGEGVAKRRDLSDLVAVILERQGSSAAEPIVRRKRPFEPFMYKNDLFTKTGSEQT